jgi:2-polyprenyl-3-methyl-5-hydroxy-6-metoxy-1,4-benzoquinol methylase
VNNKNLYNDKEMSYYGYIRRDVLDLVPSCKRLLDVGCGAGVTSRALLRMGRCQEAYGLELSAGAAREAKQNLTGALCCDFTTAELPFELKSFDVILCLDVLEHLADPWQGLKKLAQYLHDDGVAIASVPNIANIRVLWKIVFNQFEYETEGILDKSHLRFFTLHTVKKLFTECGFEISRVVKNRDLARRMKLLGLCTLGIAWHYNVVQYLVVANKINRE